MKNIFSLMVLLAMMAVGPVFGQRLSASENALRVNLLSGDKSTVTVRSVGNGSNQATCAEDAGIKAMKTVLFVGLSSPNTSFKCAALVTDMGEDAPYFQSFFADQTYKRYVTVCEPSSSLDKVKGQKKKEQAFDIVINTNALETQLRRDKVIKRMGLQ